MLQKKNGHLKSSNYIRRGTRFVTVMVLGLGLPVKILGPYFES